MPILAAVLSSRFCNLPSYPIIIALLSHDISALSLTSCARTIPKLATVACSFKCNRDMATQDHVANLRQPVRRDNHDTVFTEVLATSFMKYHDAYQKISPNASLSKLPQIVVVGLRNVGKSSLLENITKCSIFPRENSLCTKVPIRLRLKQVRTADERKRSVTYQGTTHEVDMDKEVAEGHKDILHIIRDIMQNVEGLGEDDIEVDISETDVPTVEVVDLPGIQKVPPEAAKKSVHLVNKFLRKSDRHTIVLCVIPAISGDFAGDNPLSLVHSPPASTIFALTKADKVEVEEDLEEVRDQLFLPLLGRHEDLKHTAGCVAVANRKHNDSVSLEDQRIRETAFFKKVLAAATAEFATHEVQQQLIANMGSKQLIVQLAAMYRKHVVEHWIPEAQADARAQLDTAQQLLQQGGPPPEEMQGHMQETLADIQAKVNFGVVCLGMVGVVSQVMQDAPTYLLAGSSANLLEWAESTIDNKHKLAQVVDKVMVTSSKEYERVACKAYDAVFARDTSLQRFPALKEEVKMRNIPNRILEGLTAAKPAIAVMVTNAEQQLYNGSLSQQDVVQVIQQLKHSMGRCIVEHMVKSLKHTPLSLPPDFHLFEDEATARESREQRQHIESLTRAINDLEELKGVES